MNRVALTLMVFCISLSAYSQLEPPNHFYLDDVRTIPILEGGRHKPLDTFAGETLKTLTGRWNYHGDPVAMLFSLMVIPGWSKVDLIRIDYQPLKETLGLDIDKTYFTFDSLVSNPHLKVWLDRVSQKTSANEKLDRLENAVSKLFHQLSLLREIQSGEAFTVVPPAKNDPEAAWLIVSQNTDYSNETRQALLTTYTQLLDAVRKNNTVSFQQAGIQFKDQLAQLNTFLTPKDSDMQREVYYNHFRPFLKAWIFYLLAFLLFLVSFSFTNKIWYWVSLSAFLIGFGFTAYGLLLRSLISGRAPVSNMYESVVFVGWMITVFALIFELFYRDRWFATAASFLGVGMLILADLLPFDSNIEPLMPVLRSNYWLIIHVLTITTSYSAFALALGMAHINLGIYFYLPNRNDLLQKLSLFLYRVLQVGVVFLAAGTILGGVWANESWGRFWGWDPKETWALISLLGYMAILHARSIGWISYFGTAVASVFGFWLILMTWYGVNFVLSKGLHSYGFGTGGGWYVVGFLLFEVIFVIGVVLKYRMSTPMIQVISEETGKPGII